MITFKSSEYCPMLQAGLRTMPIMSALAALRQTAPDPGPGQRGAREPPVSGDGDGEEEPPVTPVTCPVSPWCDVSRPVAVV